MSSNQHRLLLLKQLLDEETDQKHPISIQNIIDRLKTSLPTMKMDARTIRADLKALDQVSFSVYSEKGKFGKLLYSRGERLFNQTELRLLMDAVFAVRFLPHAEKERMIDRLKLLVSRPAGENLPDVLLENYGPSWLFGHVQRQIEPLQRAMGSSHCIAFQYGHPDREAKKKIGCFAPYVLTWQDDFCHIVGKDMKTGQFIHYRVDRMSDVVLLEDRFEKEDFDFQLYAEKHFFLFSKRGESVELRFDEACASRLTDQFGPGIVMEKDGHGGLLVKLKTERLGDLQGWLLEWGSEVEVLEPESLRNSIKKEIARMQAIYKERT